MLSNVPQKRVMLSVRMKHYYFFVTTLLVKYNFFIIILPCTYKT